MKTWLKLLLFGVLVISAQTASATPQADSNYLAQRNLSPTALQDLQRILKEPFVEVYFRPLSELGIEIIDMDRFVDLIPDEDIAPVLERYMSRTARQYLSNYTPEQLSAIAALLRADPDTSTLEILSEVSQRTLRAGPNLSLDDKIVFSLAPDTAASSIAALLFFGGYGREVAELHREPDNPVTMAAIEADGILRFANPVQRQTLLRQFSVSEETGGIRFAKPPSSTRN